MKLKVKFIISVVAALMVVMGATAYLVVHFDERKALQTAISQSATVMELIENDIRDVIMSGNSQDMSKALDTMGTANNLVSLRILSDTGSIIASNTQGEVGAKSRSYLLGGYKDSGQAALEGTKVTLYRPLAAGLKCQGCHDGQQGAGDLLEMTFDITPQMEDASGTGRLVMVSGAVAMLSVAIILSFLLNRHILSPVGAVMETLRSVEKGNLDERITVRSADEIGAAGAYLNKMLDGMKALAEGNLTKERELQAMRADLQSKQVLAELNAKLSFKVKELEAANKTILTLSKEVRAKNDELGRMLAQMKEVNDVARKVSSHRYPDEIAKVLLRSAAEMLGAQEGSLVAECEHGDTCAFTYNTQSGVERAEKTSLLQSADKGGGNGHRAGRLEVPLNIKGRTIGTMTLQKRSGGREFGDNELQVATALSGQAAAAIENAWLYEERRGNFLSTLRSLVGTLEGAEGQLTGHSERVRFLSVELARHIHLEPEAIESLEYAALLHDVGKAALDARILAKAGPLSRDELELVRSHPLLSDEILGTSAMFNGARAAILQHHEHLDGSGFPMGLKGDQITLKARILRVTDLFDVMVTEKPYRRALSVAEALDQLVRSAGSMLDPYIAQAFVEMIRQKDTGFLLSAGYENPVSLTA